MEFNHRKLLPPKSISITRSLSECEDGVGKCKKPPPSYEPPDHIQSKQSQNYHVPLMFVLMLCVLGAAFLFLYYLTIFKKLRSNSNNSRIRARNPPQFEDARENFIDENHGPLLDNPIWYIHTIGLPQSIIDSIALFKYKKDEVLIEGTECSVCLNEFQEDETLRLLPKCSHAFHIPCIDTWLRSHKNCPLCRAPIVCESNNDQASVLEPNSNDLGHREENLENQHVGEDIGTSEVSDDDDDDEVLGEFSTEEEMISKILHKNSRHSNAKNRVFSDLGDHHRLNVEKELEPKRRSISMDSSSASMIYLAIANYNISKENEGSSSTKPVVPVKKSNSEMVSKKLNRNSSLYRLVKSSSLGRSFQNRHVSMKRSFSTTGKQFFSRRSSQEDSFLVPL